MPQSASSRNNAMKRFLAVLAAILMFCMTAQAEESAGFIQGGCAAKLADEYFVRVHEGATDALVRIDAEGTPHISIRADELGDMAAMDGTLYYLMQTDNAWSLMGLNDGGVFTAYAFADGIKASDIGARAGMLFTLADDKLHIIYPQQGLCLQLAGARMAEYAVHDDYAYFVSMDNTTKYRLADGDGNVAEYTAGSLCRVNLSTGETTTIVSEGADDLKYADGKLYFHNYADRYLMGAGADMTVEGRLYSYDIADGSLTKLTDSYDWDYVTVNGEPFVLRQDGIIRLTDGETIAMIPDSAQMYGAEDAIICFDAEVIEFSILK